MVKLNQNVMPLLQRSHTITNDNTNTNYNIIKFDINYIKCNMKLSININIMKVNS